MNQLEVVGGRKVEKHQQSGLSLKVIQNELIELYMMVKSRPNRDEDKGERRATEIHRLSKMEIGALI